MLRVIQNLPEHAFGVRASEEINICNVLAPLNKGVKPYSSYGDGLHKFKEPYAT